MIWQVCAALMIKIMMIMMAALRVGKLQTGEAIAIRPFIHPSGDHLGGEEQYYETKL